MSNLQLRLLSSLVLIPVIFGAIIIGGLTFKIFIGLAFVIALYESITLSLKTTRRAAFIILGSIYLSFCFYEFYSLRHDFENGLYLVLTMLVVVWAGDTGAYFIGRKFGKHKMAPTISPNKSWEGLFGSALFSSLFLLLPIYFAGNLSAIIPNVIAKPDSTETVFLLLIGGLLGYIGQVGDLIESFLKRSAGAKDSGHLIPGHGGILDRVDSLLLVAPFFVFIARYVL